MKINRLCLLLVFCAAFACKDKESSALETSDSAEGQTQASEGPTYYQDVAPILHFSCNHCHQTEGLNPDIVFDDYASASLLSSVINAAVQSRRMPPFKAQETDECSPPYDFIKDPRLSEEQILTLNQWVEDGAPEGDPSDAAPLINPPNAQLEGTLQTLLPEVGYTTSPIGALQDEFICYSLNPELEDDSWLEAFELLPDDSEVVHHILVGVDNSGESGAMVDENGIYPCFGGFGLSNVNFIGGWIPGAGNMELPENSAIRVPKEGRIVLQMHYHLISEERTDRTGISLRWSDNPPIREASFSLTGNGTGMDENGNGLLSGMNDTNGVEFLIPADEPAHVETMKYTLFPYLLRGKDLFMIANHMHYVGQDMKVWLDGQSDDCLLQTPDWDFGWQQFYYYDVNNGQSPTLYPSDELWIRCTYNNTLDNTALLQNLQALGLSETVDVTLGEGSLDEMCLALTGTVPQVNYKIDSPSHRGNFELQIGVGGADGQSCYGQMDFEQLENGTLHGLGACGLFYSNLLYSFEFEYNGDTAGGPAEVRIVDVIDTPELVDWNLQVNEDAWGVSVNDYIVVQDLNISIKGEIELLPFEE